MLQPATFTTENSREHELAAIREAFNRDRSQMTLMLVHRLQITEVEILRALEGDLAHEFDAARW